MDHVGATNATQCKPGIVVSGPPHCNHLKEAAMQTPPGAKQTPSYEAHALPAELKRPCTPKQEDASTLAAHVARRLSVPCRGSSWLATLCMWLGGHMHKMRDKPIASLNFWVQCYVLLTKRHSSSTWKFMAALTRTSGTLWPSFSPSGRLDDLWVSLINCFHNADTWINSAMT